MREGDGNQAGLVDQDASRVAIVDQFISLISI